MVGCGVGEEGHSRGANDGGGPGAIELEASYVTACHLDDKPGTVGGALSARDDSAGGEPSSKQGDRDEPVDVLHAAAACSQKGCCESAYSLCLPEVHLAACRKPGALSLREAEPGGPIQYRG